MKKGTPEWNEWCDLYEYVKKDVLQYGEEKKIPKYMVLRLMGLKEGKFMSNKNQKAQAKYEFKTILLTFKMCKAKISQYIAKNNGNFENEQHKFNGIMIIIESEINNVVDILSKAKKSETTVKKMELKNQTHDGAEYKGTGKKNTNKKLDGLW